MRTWRPALRWRADAEGAIVSGLLRRLGVSLPIVQAPMAGVSTSAMAAAVSNAGALGSIAIGAVSVTAARAMIAAVRDAASGAFNVNVFCHRPATVDRERENAWLDALAPLFRTFGAEPPTAIGEIYKSFAADPEMVDLVLEMRPPVVSFHLGLPPRAIIDRLKAAGIVLFATATTLAEADEVAAVGIDAIVAQGYEAGGHRGVFDPHAGDPQLGVLPLTRLLARQNKIPVIAAGGIMDGAGIAAALALGAEAAQLGTAFIACSESAADAHYRAALFSPAALATEMTRVISGRPARCLPNKFSALARGLLHGVAIPDYPVAYDAGKALASAANGKANGEFGAHWAGQGAPAARPLPTTHLVEALAQELAAAR